ncbi:hypothetical protein [Bradyrhizobium sacchari]|uniref:Uncharacterized protein n=1 Tax=Bradyrhizobium sacchari TaxID=1399419 RepID=A0A560HKG0_9BRAD|nr:hypothetical protein [Bradyrhizobium sacchari]TWB46986.1 hypothetical protein FBZ94_1224 [Bradyrhizobium sacchari]TWB65902.1 hypothetical protein FBZ95_12115 [Bradyrhizobium sacchari]
MPRRMSVWLGAIQTPTPLGVGIVQQFKNPPQRFTIYVPVNVHATAIAKLNLDDSGPHALRRGEDAGCGVLIDSGAGAGVSSTGPRDPTASPPDGPGALAGAK